MFGLHDCPGSSWTLLSLLLLGVLPAKELRNTNGRALGRRRCGMASGIDISLEDWENSKTLRVTKCEVLAAESEIALHEPDLHLPAEIQPPVRLCTWP